MKDKKAYIYFVIAYIMTILPVLNLFSFIPMYMMYKNSNFKYYIVSTVLILVFSLLWGFSFLNLGFAILSFLYIKYFENRKRHYDLIFIVGVIICMFMVFDFVSIRFDEKLYSQYVEVIGQNFKQIEQYGLSMTNESPEEFLDRLVNFYPLYAFIVGYSVSTFGYLFLYKRYIKLPDVEFNKLYILPVSYIVMIVTVVINLLMGYLENLVGYETAYRIALFYNSIFLGFMFIFLVQGFVVFNRRLKIKMSPLVANMVSAISLFLALPSFMYLIYGTFNSVMRRENDGKKIS